MKNESLTLFRCKCSRTATAALAAILTFSACNSEKVEIEQPVKPQGAQLTLSISEASDVTVYSTATKNENRIEDCVVLVNHGGTFAGEYIDVTKIVSNGQATPILPQLTTANPETGDAVYVICNTGTTAAGFATAMATVTTEASINTAFPLAKSTYLGGEAMPMSGKIDAFSISNKTVVMTRAVAKIQVQLGSLTGSGVADMTGNFTLNNVVWDVCNYGATKSPTFAPATIASVAGTANTTNNSYLLQREGATEAQTTVYIPEYKSSTGGAANDSIFNKARQCILLKKTDNGKDYFYRLDFYDTMKKKFIDTKRNFHYIFAITKVRSEGYLNADEALKNPGSNIEYTVISDKDNFRITISDGQYALMLEDDSIKGTITSSTYTSTLRVLTHIPTATLADITTHYVKVYDKNGNLVGASGSVCELIGYNAAVQGTEFTADNTIQSINYTVNNPIEMNGGYFEVWLGNIVYKIPVGLKSFMLPGSL